MCTKTLQAAFFCFVGCLCLLGCEKKHTSTLKTQSTTQSKRIKKQSIRPQRTRKPECTSMMTPSLRCLAYCGSIRFLSHTQCKRGQWICWEGIREDRCDGIRVHPSNEPVTLKQTK